MFELNINGKVYVRLTRSGMNTYRKHFEQLRAGANRPKKDTEGWCEFSLQELMDIFGTQCYAGAPSQFIGGIVRVKPSSCPTEQL